VALKPHAQRPHRLVAACVCSPNHPFLECDAPAQEDPLLAIPGIGEEIAAALRNRGIRTLRDMEQTPDEVLLEVPGIGEKVLHTIREGEV
jgi:predicted flap endonuclease-1-like 5' DNA nuclease